MNRQEKARKAACTTDRIEALNTDEPLIREDVQSCKVLLADVANAHQSNIREQAQTGKLLHAYSAPEEYAESQLLEAASATQKAALVLGSPLIRHWFDEALLARAQGDLMQIQVQMLAKLQRLNKRALESLHASEEHGERCGCRTISCGVDGTSQPTGEEAVRGADGSPSSASSSAHSSGAGGGRGLPGASAHTPAGHTVQVSRYRFLRRREDGSARG